MDAGVFAIHISDEWPEIAAIIAVLTPIVSGVTLLLVWFYHQKLGVSVAQAATASARKEVVELQERRIALLEADVSRLSLQVQYLTSENDEYRRRIRHLEKEVENAGRALTDHNMEALHD